MASFAGSVASGKNFSTARWERLNESIYIRTKRRDDTTTTVMYAVKSLIGHGGFGRVYKLIPDDPTNKCKAIKICKACQTYPGSTESACELIAEHKILESLPPCDGLPKPPKAFFPYEAETKFPASMILHLYDFDCSEDFHSKLTEIELLDAFRQLAKGLESLHSQGIYHRDLTLVNLMYDLKNKKAVIIDPRPKVPFWSPETCVQMDVTTMAYSFHLCLFPKLGKPLILAQLNYPEKVKEILDSSSDTSTISSKLEAFYKSYMLTDNHPSLRYVTQRKKFDLEIQFLLIAAFHETSATGLLKAIDKVIAAYNAKS